MSTVKDRLLIFIKMKGLTTIDFERSINVSSGYVKNISKSIQPEKLELISNLYPELNLEWLLIGKGEMEKESTASHHVSAGRDAIGNVNGNVIGNGHNIGMIPADCERKLVRAKAEVDILKRKIKEIETKHKQEKDVLNKMLEQAILDKDKAMSMLEKALSR